MGAFPIGNVTGHPTNSIGTGPAAWEVAGRWVASGKPVVRQQISRFMFAMFDVLGFSRWLDSVGLQAVLDAYHLLIERVVVRPNAQVAGWRSGVL